MVIRNTNYTRVEIARIKRATSIKKITPSQKNLMAIADKLYIFRGIEQDAVIRMTKNVKFASFKKGSTIMKEGDNGRDIFFILNGEAIVVIPHLNNKVVARISSGNMFGEMAFITKSVRSATIIGGRNVNTILTFEIDETKHNDMFSYPFSVLYKNIALDLANKIKISNEKA